MPRILFVISHSIAVLFFILPEVGLVASETAFPQQDLQLTGQESAWLKEHPVIKVMNDPYYAPIEFRTERGEWKGFSLDLLKRLSPIIGSEFRSGTEENWTASVKALIDQKYDMATGVARTPIREKDLYFFPPVAILSHVIYGGLSSPYIEDFRQILDSRVLVIEGYAIIEMITEDFPDFKPVTAPDPQTAIIMLSRGKADYFVSDIATAGYYIQKTANTNIKIVGETPYNYEVGFTTSLKNTELIGILTKALAMIPENELDAIRRQWFAAKAEKPFNYRILLLTAAFIILLAGIAAVWIRMLTSMVKTKTAMLSETNASLIAEMNKRAETEKQLQKSLEEKELLLKELRHRIKNNLQMVIGLIRITSSETGGDTGLLEDAAGRIEAIARVHDRLNEDKDSHKVYLSMYLGDIADDLEKSMLKGTKIIITKELDPEIRTSMKTAANLGLIANELLTNSCKYAFKNREPGTIRMVLSSGKAGMTELKITDDGTGFNSEAIQKRGIGISLVFSIAEGMGAKAAMATSPGEGCSWSVLFK